MRFGGLQGGKALNMTRQAILERTIRAINQLPEEKAEEISTFAEFIMKQYEEHQLSQGIQKMAARSSAFDFLNIEEDLYTESDLKEVYNDKSDIVLITFPFTDLSRSKLRPAVVLVDTPSDITVCFIATQIGLQEPTDVLLQPNVTNGLRKQSLLRTGKIVTLDKSLTKGLLGRLTSQETADLNAKLKTLLQLP